MVFAAKGQPGRVLLAGWIAWARRCRIPEFVKLAATITRFLPLIRNTLVHGMSNARSEATNTHLRALTTGLRIPHPRIADLHGHAHPRRPAHPSPEEITHENNRRASIAGHKRRIQAVIATQTFPANRPILPRVSATRASCGDDR